MKVWGITVKETGTAGIRLVFKAEDNLCAEKITVYEGPLEKGEAFEAVSLKTSAREADKGTESAGEAAPEGACSRAEAAEVFLPDASAGSVYSCKLEAKECYIYTGVIEFTEGDAVKGMKNISYRMEKRRGSGFESVVVSRWTDAVENRCFDTDSLKGFDKSVPDTPAFRKDKGPHQFTSQTEVFQFLKKICASRSGAYMYELKAQGGCPAVIFTRENLKNAGTLDEAMQILAADGRLKALYQAQLHGNEPASGEGALAAAGTLAGIYSGLLCGRGWFSRESEQKQAAGLGRPEQKQASGLRQPCPDIEAACRVLPATMDIVIVPSANENGSREFSRWETLCVGENRAGEISGSGSEGEKLDLNRDALLLRSEVTRAVHHIFCVLMPEIFIDAHEFSGRKRQVCEENGRYFLDSLDDIQITCVDHLNRDRRIFELENRIMLDSIDSLSEKGFRSFFFPGSFAQNTSCGYARMMYALTFLVESNGIRRGKLQYARRVLSQREAVLEILLRAAAEADIIRTTVSAAREAFVNRGGGPDGEDAFVLEQKIREGQGTEKPRESFDFSGNVLDRKRRVLICNRGEAVRRRIRPAAYVLAKDSRGAARAVKLLSENGARYEELEEGRTLPVEEYLRKEDKIVTGCAEYRTFEAGAYVFFLDQMAANVISASLEPDLGDVTERNGSFLQAGILHWEDDICPVYRLVFQENRSRGQE